MSAPTSAPVADDKSPLAQSALYELPVQIEEDTERTKSSLARLTSHSIDRLERLLCLYSIGPKSISGVLRRLGAFGASFC